MKLRLFKSATAIRSLYMRRDHQAGKSKGRQPNCGDTVETPIEPKLGIKGGYWRRSEASASRQRAPGMPV